MIYMICTLLKNKMVTRYESPAMTQEKAMTLDLTLDSFSNTAMEEIKDMTRATKAMRVIVFISALYPLKKKHRAATMHTVRMYLIAPP